MKILFIGNFQAGPGGEDADETHITSNLEEFGNEVYRIPRDEWREYVIENQPKDKYKVPEDAKPDIAIICKWHHFYDGRFIDAIKSKYGCPVFYWVWDYMEGSSVEDWHMKMCQSADLYLAGELGLANYYHQNGVKFYYFQFDSADNRHATFPSVPESEKEFDVIYPGSCNNQNGRLDLLKEVNKEIPIKVFAYDHEEWKKHGFDASPAVYGEEFNRVISKSKIVLGTSGGPNCFGYWSNRVGKVLYAGGFLLQQYAPGMELFLAGKCDFYSSAQEAILVIKYYLEHPEFRASVQGLFAESERFFWGSNYKVFQLLILMNKYLKTNGGALWQLP